MYLGYLPKTLSKRDKYLINVLLVAGKKTFTRKWLTQECSTLKTWTDVTVDIYNMEITWQLQTGTVFDILGNMGYIPHSPDFIFINQMHVQ